ncbi:enoyl-CoA hydratase/isomerase family protein [Desulfotignum balticum]|uniref:Putative enoyl-CoA hydratase/isomerase n=1 Tax=Desulfotignum balticum TaxID=115781 RepID=C4B7T4_9BACT|nr:enoyl-CoA hydratase/isomerase family protein [Desulfotignum balticum]BAH60916.1 putative enoyl-CoA hydratase/isomerase [Desulfotignum balticum]
MNYTDIQYEIKQGIGYITLYGPKKLNLLTRESIAHLAQILSTCREDKHCRAVILTGSGEKAFSAGANIDIFSETGQEAVKAIDWSVYGQEAFGILRKLGKPSIAAVNGLALGGGFEIALSCTFRLASQNAKLGLTEITLGFLPGWGGTQLLTRLVGKTAAMELILSGDIIDAETAYRLGIVSEVVPRENLISRCETLVNRIIKNSAIAVKNGMEAVEYAADLSLNQGLLLESKLAGISCATEESKERVTAFLEKRAGK